MRIWSADGLVRPESNEPQIGDLKVCFPLSVAPRLVVCVSVSPLAWQPLDQGMAVATLGEDGKVPLAQLPALGGGGPHTHPISDVVDLMVSLAAKAAVLHAHAVGDVTGLQATLDGKAAQGHPHIVGDVADLVTQLSARALVGHVHAQADVTGLGSTLDGKAAASHMHQATDIIGLSSGAWTTVRKVANEARVSSATLANDSALFASLSALTRYAIRLKVFFDTAASPDFKYALTGPASPTFVRVMRRHMPPSAAPGTDNQTCALDLSYTSSVAVVSTGTTGGYIEMEAIVQTGAAAGVFAFQWAQNTANAAATTVLAGSRLEWALA